MTDPSEHGNQQDLDGTDRAPGPPVTFRLGTSGRGPGIAAGLIAVFVAVALVKPWTFGGTAAPRPTPRIAPAPVAAPPTDPLAELRRHCQEPTGWRIYSRERWATMTVRSWRSFDPAFGATGPLDPAIPMLPLLGAQVDALGYCSPWAADARPPDGAHVTGWRIVSGASGVGLLSAETIALHPVDPSWPSILGALYGPPVNRFDSTIVDTVGWPGGRYVFTIRAPGYERWWGVDLVPPAQAAGPEAVEVGGDATASGKAASP